MCSSPITDPATCSTAGSQYGYGYQGETTSAEDPAGCFLDSNSTVSWNSIITYPASSTTNLALCLDLTDYAPTEPSVSKITSGTCASLIGADGRSLDYIGGQDTANSITKATELENSYLRPSGAYFCPSCSSAAFYFNNYLVGPRLNLCEADNIYSVAMSSAGASCTNFVRDSTDCQVAALNMAMDFYGPVSSSSAPSGCILWTSKSQWAIAFNEFSKSTIKCTTSDDTLCICRRFSLTTLAACPAGSWMGTAATCVACAAGRYSAAAGSLSCFSCPLGFYSTSGSLTPCPAGYYGASTGLSACTACSAGYSTTSAATACDACIAGTYWSDGICVTCPNGQYQGNTAQLTCTSCALGQYQDAAGASSCTFCPFGTFSIILGSSSSSTCQNCPPGSFVSSDQASCVQCLSGQFANAALSQCFDCVSGEFAPQPQTNSCLMCNSGFYSFRAVGDTSAATRLAACSVCNAGHFAATTGSTSCTSCQPGQAQGAAAQVACATPIPILTLTICPEPEP